jgi:ppGpp synthetase/RelA/SpoT-type nucleotidyltranferase
MIDKSEFLDKYDLNKTLLSSRYSWDNLIEVVDDYECQKEDLNIKLNQFVKDFSALGLPVYIKKRLKDPEHLVEKILRKEKDNGKKSDYVNVTLQNYQEEITDLIGIRVIHTFKVDWRDVHLALVTNFSPFHEKPEVFYRKGDDVSSFNDFSESLDIKESDRNYRSAHYLVKRENYIAEIQVRTIFEEAWGEVDHSLVYPNKNDDKLLKEFGKILNRIAGAGDELSSIMRNFAAHQDEIQRERKTIMASIRALRVVLNNCDISSENQDKIEELLECIQEDKNKMIPFRTLFEDVW